jgi:hypothetical protein
MATCKVADPLNRYASIIKIGDLCNDKCGDSPNRTIGYSGFGHDSEGSVELAHSNQSVRVSNTSTRRPSADEWYAASHTVGPTSAGKGN